MSRISLQTFGLTAVPYLQICAIAKSIEYGSEIYRNHQFNELDSDSTETYGWRKWRGEYEMHKSDVNCGLQSSLLSFPAVSPFGLQFALGRAIHDGEIERHRGR